MSEVSRLAIPNLEEEAVISTSMRAAKWIGGKTLDLLDYPPVLYTRQRTLDYLGRDTVLSTKERLVSGAALGGLAVASAVAEYKYGQELKDASFPIGFFVFSGKHFVLGGLAAARINAQSRWNSLKGMLAAGAAADLAGEAGQSVTITGFLHQGWANVMDFVKPEQWQYGNTKDLAAALIAVGGVFSWSRLRDRRSNTSQEPFPPPATESEIYDLAA